MPMSTVAHKGHAANKNIAANMLKICSNMFAEICNIFEQILTYLQQYFYLQHPLVGHRTHHQAHVVKRRDFSVFRNKYNLLYEYRDLFIDMAVRNNRSELAIANRHQER